MIDEIASVATVLGLPAGFQVCLFGDMLTCYRLENGQYAVLEANTGLLPPTENLFPDALTAAQFFCERRAVRQLGYDHEVVPR